MVWLVFFGPVVKLLSSVGMVIKSPPPRCTLGVETLVNPAMHKIHNFILVMPF